MGDMRVQGDTYEYKGDIRVQGNSLEYKEDWDNRGIH